jgi:DNA-binding transcriptional LysR family regulator
VADRFRTALDWEDVRFFVALARHGSLSAAARALKVNHATVARRLAGLEQALGCALFDRRPGGYELTAAGRTALSAAGGMETGAAALSALSPEPALTGLVRVTSTPSLAELFLIPRLAPLQRQHPMLDLEVVAERRLISLQRRQSDIALRFGRPEGGELLARRVASLAYRFYGTASWRTRLEQGETASFIGFDEEGTKFPEAVWLARHFGKARLAVRCNNQIGQLAAARAGLGVAMLPRFLAAGEPALVEIELSKVPPTRELWLLTRRDVRTTPAVRAVTDFLVDLFRRERSLFSG